MPLSQCPQCGFTCRSLIVTTTAPTCPECESQMSFIGRATLDESKKLRTPATTASAAARAFTKRLATH
jgi:hypothetical protein